MKERVADLADAKGKTVETLSKEVIPTRKELRRLLIDGGPTRNFNDVLDLADLLDADAFSFALYKDEPFDFDKDSYKHADDPFDYDISHYRENCAADQWERVKKYTASSDKAGLQIPEEVRNSPEYLAYCKRAGEPAPQAEAEPPVDEETWLKQANIHEVS